MQKIWKLYDSILKTMLYCSAFVVLLTTVAVCVDIFLRYFFAINFAPLFEITEFGLLWMTFLGAAWVLKINGHVNIELVTAHLGSRGRFSAKLFASIVSGIMLFCMTWYSAKLTISDFKTSFELAGVLRAPKWPIEIIIPIGFLALFFQSVRNSVQLLTLKTRN